MTEEGGRERGPEGHPQTPARGDTPLDSPAARNDGGRGKRERPEGHPQTPARGDTPLDSPAARNDGGRRKRERPEGHPQTPARGDTPLDSPAARNDGGRGNRERGGLRDTLRLLPEGTPLWTPPLPAMTEEGGIERGLRDTLRLLRPLPEGTPLWTPRLASPARVGVPLVATPVIAPAARDEGWEAAGVQRAQPFGRRYGGCASINTPSFFPLPSRKGARGMVRAPRLPRRTLLAMTEWVAAHTQQRTG